MSLIKVTLASLSPDNLVLNQLPIVNLTYCLQEASSYEADGDYYIFKNIRYAEPPNGTRRWTYPVRPTSISGVQDGSYGGICPQPPATGCPSNPKPDTLVLFLSSRSNCR